MKQTEMGVTLMRALVGSIGVLCIVGGGALYISGDLAVWKSITAFIMAILGSLCIGWAIELGDRKKGYVFLDHLACKSCYWGAMGAPTSCFEKCEGCIRAGFHLNWTPKPEKLETTTFSTVPKTKPPKSLEEFCKTYDMDLEAESQRCDCAEWRPQHRRMMVVLQKAFEAGHRDLPGNKRFQRCPWCGKRLKQGCPRCEAKLGNLPKDTTISVDRYYPFTEENCQQGLDAMICGVEGRDMRTAQLQSAVGYLNTLLGVKTKECAMRTEQVLGQGGSVAPPLDTPPVEEVPPESDFDFWQTEYGKSVRDRLTNKGYGPEKSCDTCIGDDYNFCARCDETLSMWDDGEVEA